MARTRLASLLLGALLLLAAGAADARTRSFCAGAVTRSCGGHLEPACSSAPACDAGHTSYSGSPFPIKITCPSVIPDVTISSGCYDSRPDCGDCSASGQVPCPAEAEPWCTAGCDAGLAPDPVTGLCRAPRVAGDSCGPAAPCAAGFACDPLEGFRCVAKAGPDESCADPFVKCDDGLQCTLALRCSHEPARLGETCDASAPCGPELFCQAGIPQRCAPVRELGEACGPAAHCREGLSCDPFAGFVCVAPAGPNESCLFKGCREGLVCTAKSICAHRPGLVGEACDLVNRCALGSFCQRDTGGIIGALLGTCTAYRKPGESCIRDFENGTSDCVPGTSCELFLADGGTGFQCVVEGTGEPIPDPVCRSFYSPARRSEAIRLGVATTSGAGAESSGGFGTTYEAGVAYGPEGEYGCYFSTCRGVSIDVGYEAFAAAGFYTKFDAIAGYSMNFFEEAQIAGVVNFATSQIFAREGPDDLTPGALIGTADALAIGTPTNPSPVAAGALLCTSSVSEIPLVTNEYGVVEPRAVPEPGALPLATAALLALRQLSARRRRARR